MNKIKLISIAFLLITISGRAQSEDFVYRFSTDIEKVIAKDTVSWKYQLGANEYSFIGNYKKTRETWDKNGVRIPKITKEDSLYFTGFTPINAKDYIIERSKKEQIIIINEAHTNPNHRTFTYTLLQGLYDNGYRYLGLEAIFDTLINERKFPTIESGYYTKEPEFGNLISTALHIGFTVFGYDDTRHNGKEREIAQARNIAGFMKQHPEGKVLIHCGHDHVIEGTPNTPSWEKAMAGRLKEYTGIDPFTIDQAQFSERSDRKYNHPYIAMVNKAFPAVLIDKNGNLFNGKKGNDQVDVRIIHPETRYVNNRPDWLLNGGNRKEYYPERSEMVQYPLLVMAYRNNEFENKGVPADMIEIIEKEAVPPLILGKGDFEIVIKDSTYKVIDRYNIKME
ncbi:hypothetical protein [Empedobacter brevis]|uniref:hypothetical protein n=1 Tax=Empedobacter brevis TaxID=247 RepID=UPI00289D96CC|nr:hypothetical protein [Empedobacter brevis]